jgi:nicotinamidase-related amidase
VLSNCGIVLSRWRERLWPVVHLKRVAQAAWFNPASALTDWVPECRPQPGEMTFEHPMPSAYSSPRFCEYVANLGITRCIVIGFSLEEAILATAVEGFHRGQDLVVIGDAAACARPAACDLSTYRTIIFDLLKNYAAVEALESASLPEFQAI